MLEPKERSFLRTHAPQHIHWRTFIVTISFIALLCLIFSTEGKGDDTEAIHWLLLIPAFIGPLTWFQIYLAHGYRVSWDVEAIYIDQDRMSAWVNKLPERSIRYEDIESVADLGQAVGALGITPFEIIRVFERGADEDNIPSFYLTALYLYPAEMKAFVKMLHERRPETFSPTLVDWLNQPKWDPVAETSFLDD